MPSWNIHTAHAERLLHEHGAQALGIRDLDSFLLGNLLPDIYVGYMVTDLTHKIRYEETHLANAGHVPEPNYDEFFRSYGKPGHDGMVSDLILGCWAHLVADHDYNHRVREVLAQRGMEPSPEVREAKQADFDLFGRTLSISMVPHISSEVLRQCAGFRQYELDEQDLRATRVAMTAIVQSNRQNHIEGTPDYQLLGADFFKATFDEVHEHIAKGLMAYVSGDANWGAGR